MKKLFALILTLAGLASSCNQHKLKPDASGVFESDEVIVSARESGQLLSFLIKEGDTISEGAIIGDIDMSNTALQKQQVQASIDALGEKTTDPRPQIDLVV